MDALFRAAKASGNPYTFLSNNYKKYGLSSSSGLTTDYKNWLEAGGGQLKYKDLSREGKQISDLMDSNLTQDYDRVLDRIEALDDPLEQDYLLRQLSAYLK